MRIASLISSGTEILYSLGLDDHVVAVGYECDYPPRVADKPRVTRSNINSTANSSEIDAQVRELLAAGNPLYEINRERLCALAPTLIVTQSQCDVCAIRYEDVKQFVATEPSLRQTRIVALNPHSVDDIFGDIMTIATATGRAADGLAHVAKLQQRIAYVRDQIRDIKRPPPRVACIEWTEPLMLAANCKPLSEYDIRTRRH